MARSFVTANLQGLYYDTFYPGYPFSVSLLVKPTSTAAQNYFFSFACNPGSASDFHLIYQATDGKIGTWSQSASPAVADNVSGGSTSVGTWYSVVVVMSAANSRVVYVDGSSVATGSTAVTPAGINRVSVGAHMSTGPLWATIEVAEVAIWDAGLSAAEALVLGTKIKPLAVRPQSLVSYWPVMGRTSPEIEVIGGKDFNIWNAAATAAHPPIVYPGGLRKIKMAGALSTATGKGLAKFSPAHGIAVTSNYATLALRNRQRVLQFNDTTNESVVFFGTMPSNYSGNGIAVHILASAASATSGVIKWGASIERTGSETIDIDADDFSATNNVNLVEAPATSGYLKKFTIFFADGADMNNVTAGDQFRLKIFRDAVSDTATGDAEIHNVEIQEVS